MVEKKKDGAIINKRLIFRLNNLCFGMHGFLSALLKDLHYFFYFKKHQNNALAKVYMQCVFSQLKNIINLSNLIEELGGYYKIYDYKNNGVDYYKPFGKQNIAKEMAILDSISSQILLIGECFSINQTTTDIPIKDMIDKTTIEMTENINLLSAHLPIKSGKCLIISADG